MQYKLYSSNGNGSGDTSDITVIGVFQDENIGALLQSVSKETSWVTEELSTKIAQSAGDEKFVGKANQHLSLPTYGAGSSKKVVLYGLGAGSAFTTTTSRKMAANIVKTLKPGQTTKVNILLRDFAAADGTASSGEAKPVDTGIGSSEKSGEKTEKKDTTAKVIALRKLGATAAKEHLRAFAEGWSLGGFSFNRYKTTDSEEKKGDVDATVDFAGLQLDEAEVKNQCKLGESIAAATNLARKLIAEPPAEMTPTKLAENAQAIANAHGLECKLLGQKEVEALKMGSFLGVAKGAKEPLRFIILKYTAPGAKKTVAIVGKGITFDSGGLSLKPAASMENMKYDMAGAAAVIAAMEVVGAVKPAVSVLALVAATENMPGSGALHPGDVLTAMNGKTIEVNNTDAEGRLVLADALTYAAQQGVDEIIDLATLTGAIVTALGRAAAGIMGNNQALIDGVIKSGAKAGEKFWQMPLYDEYKDYLKSDIADLKNAGARGEAGSSAGGMFLQEFCGGKAWAHLDIAGPGWMEKPRDELTKGGTGFGVRTLCYYLLGL
jgi:leucyl aminopeptidase